MRIGILGSGLMGGKLGTIFAKAVPSERIARYLEPFTVAIAQLAYEGDRGPEIAYRIERFGK